MKYYFSLLLICISIHLLAQDLGIVKGVNARHFQIEIGTDTIDFLKMDASLQIKKPVLICLQGSLPIPLIIDYPQGTHLTSFPYPITELQKTHHIINISMPHIPLRANVADIATNGSLKDFPIAYTKANYLQNYIARTNAVIQFLVQQDWVAAADISIFGHSQGSLVGIKVANNNPYIRKLGISGCNPFGRFEQSIRQIRLAELKGKITSEAAQSAIEANYERWAHYSQNRYDDSQTRGDTFKATFSFSENYVDDLEMLQIPLHIMYGTRDIGAISCDYLPIAFERIQKQNYTMQVFPGLGHNYEEINEDGGSNYDKMYWDKAFQTFYTWLRENKS